LAKHRSRRTKSVVSYVQSRILSCLGHGAVQFAEPRGEILSCEAPFERLGDCLVVTLECEQAVRKLLQGPEVIRR